MSMIEKLKTPTNSFEFRRLAYLVLAEALGDFATVTHENRNHFDGFIAVRFNETTRAGSTTGDINWMPDANLVFMNDHQLEDYLKFSEQRLEAAVDKAREEDEDDDDEDDDQGEDEDEGPAVEFSTN